MVFTKLFQKQNNIEGKKWKIYLKVR